MTSFLLGTSAVGNYASIGLLILLVTALAIAIAVVSHAIGARRSGPVKDTPYESGMPVIGDARRRFNVKFYIVAMLFLLFDVEIVFLWPWAPLFVKAATQSQSEPVAAMAAAGFGKGFLLVEVAVFLAILLVGYAYAWRRGVFKWS